MNTATFRTLCETMGIEQSWIAEELNVGIRSVRRWCSPRETFVPPFAEAFIREWWERFQDLVSNAVEDALERAKEDPNHTVLRRCAVEDSLEAYGSVPTLSMHTALLGLVAAVLAGEGLDVAFEWREE